jgi:hypothetical protein
MDNRGEARVGGSVAQEVIPGHNRLKTVDRPEVLRDAPTRTILGTTRACLPISKTRPPPARILPDPVQSHVLFSTKSGLDVTPKIIELMWLASGRNYLSFEEIQKHCANHKGLCKN